MGLSTIGWERPPLLRWVHSKHSGTACKASSDKSGTDDGGSQKNWRRSLRSPMALHSTFQGLARLFVFQDSAVLGTAERLTKAPVSSLRLSRRRARRRAASRGGGRGCPSSTSTSTASKQSRDRFTQRTVGTRESSLASDGWCLCFNPHRRRWPSLASPLRLRSPTIPLRRNRRRSHRRCLRHCRLPRRQRPRP